jgi:hypothetical protein
MRTLLTMKMAILLPLATGSCQISAQMPPTTLIAQLPPIPTNNLKTTSAPKFGATADAIEKIVRMANEYTIVPLRPYDSESGPQAIGPKTYPTRNMEVGRINRYSDVVPKCADIGAVAPDARDEDIVLFMTLMIATKRA